MTERPVDRADGVGAEPPSEEAKAISDQGWRVALTALKSLLEAG